MRNHSSTQNGFTILELVIVVVLLGILAGLSVPNYAQTKVRNEEKAAYRSLAIIKQAVNLYLFREEADNIPNLANLSAINTTLEITVYDSDNLTFQCWGTGADGDNQCTATHADGWALSTHSSSSHMIYCSAGTCPRCENDGGNGCDILE